MKTNVGKPIPYISDELLALYSEPSRKDRALQVGNVLASLGMSQIIVTAGVFAEICSTSPEAFESMPEKVQIILHDLEHISVIDKLHDIDNQNIESLRQMLLAIVKDVRVVMIKLAIELVKIRHISSLDNEQRVQHAGLIMDVFAPLANRLGIAKIKWEMEDLALRCLEPQVYKMIASSLAEQREKRETYVNDSISLLAQKMNTLGIDDPLIYGRVKHINSIYAKMKKKNKHLEQIYDLLAIRIQVETLEQCYEVLDISHETWEPIHSEYDDYIANPKPNGYQSLHTAVTGPSGKTIEIQIRTHAMHEYAELGVAAHWKYKEGTTDKESAFDKQINWLRQVLAQDDDEMVAEFKNEILEDRVYVITPQGQVIDLPEGSTPLDFAYYIHTDLGHKCRGALINERLLPIDYTLKTGETVEVLTSHKGKPSRDWLNPNSGFIKTPRARAKAKSYFRKLEKEHALDEGRQALEAVIKQFEIVEDKMLRSQLLTKFNLSSLDDLYMGVGIGDVSLPQIQNHIQAYLASLSPTETLAKRLDKIPTKPYQSTKGSVTVEGIDDLFISIASCCRPIAPEQILGFVTKTKGVSIHKENCQNIIHLRATEPERVLNVEWAIGANAFLAELEIRAEDRKGIIKDMLMNFSSEKVLLNHAEFLKEDYRLCIFKLEITVSEQTQLTRIISKLSQVRGILSVKKCN